MTSLRTDLKTWVQLLPFRQRMPSRSPPWDFMVPVFVSVLITAFLFSLMVADYIISEPASPSIDTHQILSSTTFTNSSHNEVYLEDVSEEGNTGLSVEHSYNIELKSEDGTVKVLKSQDVQGSEITGDKSFEYYLILSFEEEHAYSMDWDFKIMPEFKTETHKKMVDRGIPGSETPDFRSLLNPSFDPEAFYLWEREFGIMSNEAKYLKYRSRMLNLRNYLIARDLRHNCRTAYAGAGLFAVPLLLMDAITGKGCKWEPVIK